MRKIESYSDLMNETVTYEIGDGRCVTLDARVVREFGLAEVMRSCGVEVPTERVPVMQYGRRVGTVPGDFDLAFARSRSPFYDVRSGDLVRQGDAWIAARNLGASDLDCLVGFRRDDPAEHDKRQEEIKDETLAAIRATPSRS
jgi:hypothetical protein